MTAAEATPRWLSTREVGERLGGAFSDDTIRRMCEDGRFPGAIRAGAGGQWRVPEDDVDAWLESVKPKRGRL